jgi:16S rRNA (guanine1207-N2)-methyltransferase
MKHYFTDNSELESKPTTFTYTYKDKNILFTTDIGVFSKSMIDFGSRVMLDSMTLTKDQKTVLDIGCGYGALGISLKMLHSHLKVEMVDVNNRAVTLCKKNIEQNQLSDITVYKSNLFEKVNGTFDVIVTNPPIRAGKAVVQQILEESYKYLNTKGELWVIIQKKQGAPSAKKKMEEVFTNVEVVKRDKGYYLLKSVKMSG